MHHAAMSRIDKRNPDPRTALQAAADHAGHSLAALSRMLRRPDCYLARFVRDGHPIALRRDEHRLLAVHFGLDERGLGIRELWLPL